MRIKRKLGLSDKAIVLSLSSFAALLLSFIAGIVLVRLMTKENFGTYSQVWLFYGMIMPVLVLGIPASLYYFIPRLGSDQRNKIVLQTILLLSLLGLTLALVILAAAPGIGHLLSNQTLVGLLPVFAIFILAEFPTLYFRQLLISLDRYRMAAIYTIVSGIAASGLVVLLIVYGYGLSTIFLGLGIMTLLKLIFVLSYTNRCLSIHGVPLEMRLFREQLAYAVPLGLSAALGIIAYDLDKLFISFFFAPDRYAIYVVGAKEITGIMTIQASINAVLIVKFAELFKSGRKDEILRIWHEAIRKMALLVMPLFVFLFVIAEFLFVFLYTKNYLESAGLFRIYLFLVPLRVATYGLILQATGFTKTIFRGTLYFVLSNIVLNFVLVLLIGFRGPAVATVIATFLLALYYLSRARDKLSVGLFGIFPWGITFKIFWIACLAGLAIWPITLLNLSMVFTLLVSFLVFTMIYLLLMWKLKMFLPSDREMLKRLLTLQVLRGKS